MPWAWAEFEAWFVHLLPKPLLTPDQVKMMAVDNGLSGTAPGLAELDIAASAAEAVLQSYLRRFRTPSHQGAHAL